MHPKVLIVAEGDRAEAQVLDTYLKREGDLSFDVSVANQLSEVPDLDKFDVLVLADYHCASAARKRCHTPIVACVKNDSVTHVNGIIQDYLIKGQYCGRLVKQTVMRVIHQSQVILAENEIIHLLNSVRMVRTETRSLREEVRETNQHIVAMTG